MTEPLKSRLRSLWIPLSQLLGVLGLVVKRQRHHIGLTSLALLGVILAVGLVSNASFFAQAVDRVILTQELDDFSRITGRPPFSTSAYVFPSRRNPVTLEDAERLAAHIAGTLSGEVGLPMQHLGIQVSSGGMMLQPRVESELYDQSQAFLGNVEVVYIADIAGKMEIVEGVPLDSDGASGDVADVWMHANLVQEMGVQVGETLDIGPDLASRAIPIRLAGFWRAADPEDDFWFKDPDTNLDSALLVRRQDYITFIQPMLPSGSRGVDWYIILDDSQIIVRKSEEYLTGFRRGLDIINKYLPGARLNTPPLDPLEDFVQRNTTLTILLLSFNLPALGVLLYFLILTSAIIAQWQRKETAILVSRGMSISNVLNLTFLEQSLLCLIGYPLGVAFGMLIGRAMGYASSFLSFTNRPPLPVSLQGLSIPLTILALAVPLLARLWPAVGAARQSLVAEERERARPSRTPFWYRYYVDLFLVLPTYYAYDQLTKRGSLAALVTDRPEDLYQDPLLILVPALFVLTVSLVAMRLFPITMRMIDALASLTPWLTIHLTLRQLGRRGQDYVRPLLLVIISLAMGVYTLSMAASLDQWLVDRMYYRVGADLVFDPQSMFQQESGSPEGGDEGLPIDGNWIPAPAKFLEVDGIAGATRLGDYFGRIALSTGGEVRCRFLSIDRLDFPRVAWFRHDLADESLGSLMNRLAVAQNGILVSRDLLARHNLDIGDQLAIQVSVNDYYSVRSDFEIVGVYDYFPTVYEDVTTAVIGNMDFISLLFGATVPHDIWLDLEPGVDGPSVVKAVPRAVGIDVPTVQDTSAMIAEEQAKMERVGIFGTLTIGFLAATFMAILALLIYSYASLQERVYRFAMMHAVGLSRGQIMAQVVMEYAFLAVFGALSGALIGLFASRLFVPFFRYTGEQGVPLPPLLPVIAEQAVTNLALAFATVVILAEVVTITFALYRQLVTMIKRYWI
jgi:putative ABC transport system permease protein